MIQPTKGKLLKFHDLEQVPQFLEEGGELFFKSTIKDDWIAWITTVEMPNGDLAVLFTKQKDEPKITRNVDLLIDEVDFLKLPKLRIENNNPSFRRIFEWCDDRRSKVLAAVKRSGKSSGRLCAELDITQAVLQNLLWGTIRNPELERRICDNLGLEPSSTFPESVQALLKL